MEGSTTRTLLIISQVYVPDAASLGQHMHDVASEMARRNWRVVVLAAARGYEDPTRRYPARELIDGVHVRRFPWSSFGKASIAVRLVGGTLFLVQAILYGLFVRRVRCLLLSTSPPMCSVAGIVFYLLRRAPIKFWAMDINPDQAVVLGKTSESSVLSRLFNRLNRGILRRSTDIVALDHYMADRLQRKYPIASKVSIIPPWPHIDRLDEILAHEDNPFRTRLGLEGRFVVMYSGNISPSHPVQTILDAALRLRDRADIVFLFIGGGLGMQEIQRFADQHQASNIRTLSYRPLSELRDSLSAADVHLVSVGDAMVGIVHPCKVYGAMAVGRPVLLLGPRSCHVSDLLEEGDIGWRVPHGDAENAEQLILHIADTHPEELLARGRRAQQLVRQKYSRATLRGRFCDLLERGTVT